ncbi:hypothetical protein LUZ62_051858 [Rhynchospora pubera]|uniref:Uncharacterized protein n=1 Tax=Rhynchospora pubera TaxID=906938 RepID=A0AAV8GDL1_9POAL|nr:hypothetical protein LUZ62_081573 [Rhynchospora pubera]KAJ4800612.1 hypothetical protein LUZ62_051858 [Rhynchospora pubera]
METPNSSSTSLSLSPSPSQSPMINKNKSGRKLHRQRSRLQMQAPASIQVGPAEITSISNWQAPIPLLSPLDVSPVQHNYMSEKDHDRAVDHGTDAASTATAASAVAASGAMWRHPAEPFYYEPLPGCTPGFVFSNCT